MVYNKKQLHTVTYRIGFDVHGHFSHPSGGNGKNVTIFGVDMSSSTKIDNKGKDILIFRKGPTQGLDEHSLSAEKMYSINFTKVNTKFCLSLHYNGANKRYKDSRKLVRFLRAENLYELLCPCFGLYQLPQYSKNH